MNTWESKGGSPPPPGTTGLYHVAILYPTRAALADALRRLIAAPASPSTARATTASARRSTCDDPDGNGIELYWDRPQEEWPETPTAASRCSRDGSTCPACSPR